ncbi:MAG: AMP-dependent synthetase, partial [Chloroflexi bacterium]|nr:AMP-dependent synthetase [Chloroflexota bacterium]
MADATGARTLLEVLENGAGSHPAIVTPEGPTLTYDGLKAQIGRLMDQLRSFGIRRNDRVA